MSKKILLYNSLPFHTEMFGFFFDYARGKDMNVDVYNQTDTLKYMDFYRIFFEFNTVIDFVPAEYDLVIVLTDSDWEYKKEWVTPKTITIHHFYQLRNTHIPIQIPCANFHGDRYKENFIIPAYNIPNVTLELKKTVRTIDCVNIAIMGRFSPVNMKEIEHLKTNQIIFHMINFWGTHPDIKKDPRVVIHERPDTIALMNLLLNCQYVYVTDRNENHNKGYSSSASIALSFTTGCQLIIPAEMNKHLRLRSAITYEPGVETHIELMPDYEAVFKEKEYLVGMRNKILDSLLK